MRKPFIEIDAENFTLSQFDTKPLDGYTAPIDEKTGKCFPECCDFHSSLFAEATKWFEKFPNCCEPHRAFNGKWWFQKDNYKGIALKILKQLSYTEHHVKQQIKRQDWYKDITDYIEYNVSSFGHPAVGLHLYLEGLRHHIKHSTIEIKDSQRVELLKYIDKFYEQKNDRAPDLNLLYSAYQEWLKIFPFNLNTYFGSLRETYSKKLPLLSLPPEYNKYTGFSKAQLHTKDSFMKFLTDLTNSLLTEINGVNLYEKGLISDVNQIKLELIINSRKHKLKEGYSYNSPDETTQIKKMIGYWFEDEKKFIDEITPLLNRSENNQPKEEPGSSAKEATYRQTVGLESIFTVKEWKPYVAALVLCDPPLLSTSHEFIGNKKIHRGVVAAWFKFLKARGIVNQSLNRNELATFLSTQLKNFKISASSIDNRSVLYERTFEKQLKKLSNLD